MSKRNRAELEHKVKELENKVKQLESEREKENGKMRKTFKTILNLAAIAKLIKTITELIEWLR